VQSSSWCQAKSGWNRETNPLLSSLNRHTCLQSPLQFFTYLYSVFVFCDRFWLDRIPLIGP
jgi:hypothetical protein